MPHMKKILIILAMFTMAFMPLMAADPSVVLSLAAPAYIYAEYGAEEIEVDELLYTEDYLPLVIAAEVNDSGFALSDLFSGNILSSGKAMLEAVMLAAGFADFEPLASSGSVAFLPSIDPEKGEASLMMEFQDISMLYRYGGRVSQMSLSGSVLIGTSLFTDPLVSVSVSTGDISISGDEGASDSTVELRIYMNEELVDAYLSSKGLDRKVIREMVAGMISLSDLPLALGLDGASGEEIISYAEEHDALDLVDAAAFMMVASDDRALDEMDIISMLVRPVLFVDGSASDIDLEKAMDLAFRIISLAGVMQ